MSWLTPRKAGHPGVGGREVLARYEPRQEGALGDIRERLAGAEQEQRHEDQGDAHDAGRDGHGEDGEDEGLSQVEDDRDHPPVEPVGGRPRPDAEQQRWRDLGEVGHRDQERVVRLGGHQQRSRSERDPIAEVAEQRRSEQPAKAPTEPRGANASISRVICTAACYGPAMARGGRVLAVPQGVISTLPRGWPSST